MPDLHVVPDDRDDETTFWRDQREQRGSSVYMDAVRAEASVVMCPDCHALIGADCVNTLTGEALRRFPCHARRLTTARKANR